MDEFPVRRWVKVWIKRRKNRVRAGGVEPSVSYTLQWKEFGQDRFLSLGPYATLASARRMQSEKERELNSPQRHAGLNPVRWDAFQKRYMDTKYPEHDLPTKERLEAQKNWDKSWASCRSERLAMDNFKRLVKPGWVHEVTTEERDNFATRRLAEVNSAASVDTDLRVLRAVFNVAEEWPHLAEGRNPFAGRGKATVGARRKRQKGRQQEVRKEKHYTFEEVRAILALATKEAAEATEERDRWAKRRLRSLVDFVAYTGCRFGEAIHLEWKDIDWENGVAFLYFKTENNLKTEGSQAPFGLPDRLIAVLPDWQKDSTPWGRPPRSS